MNIREKIENWIKEALVEIGGPSSIPFDVEHPADLKNGDYSTNVALKVFGPISHGVKEDKSTGGKRSFAMYQGGSKSFKNSIDLAQKLKEVLDRKIENVEKIEIAGSGFINFYLSKEFFTNSVKEILSSGEKVGQNDLYKQEKILIEHTQPNPFKEFHIGHLMNNAIGESVARILAVNGAHVTAVGYHGDVGLHVAKALYGMKCLQKINSPYFVDLESESVPLINKVLFLGNAYAYGSQIYEKDESLKKEIQAINKYLYEKNDDPWGKGFYKYGIKASVDFFEAKYKKLDSHFDHHFYESEAEKVGKKIVLENVPKVFEKSEEAIVFRGENFEPKTHTRVFINSDGIPTYEAKEVGLAKLKKEKYEYNKSVTVTANEQDSFFDVTEVAIGEIFPDLKGKLLHLSHGMLKLPSGKMSSRTGDVITAENLIEQVKEKVQEKIKDPIPLEATSGRSRNFSDSEKEELAEMVAIGAIKYSILRQAIGGDIIFDFDKSISFEGDSGPYLQYTAVRAHSVLEKAKNLTPGPSPRLGEGGGELNLSDLERYLYRFEEVVERAGMEYAPHYIVTYLTELSAMFNSFYAREKIIDAEDPNSPYKIGLTEATFNVLKAGLKLLAIKVPERM